MKTLDNFKVCLDDDSMWEAREYTYDSPITLPKDSDSLFGFIVRNTYHHVRSTPVLVVVTLVSSISSKRTIIVVRDSSRLRALSHIFFSWS